jgi:hypothetical protein
VAFGLGKSPDFFITPEIKHTPPQTKRGGDMSPLSLIRRIRKKVSRVKWLIKLSAFRARLISLGLFSGRTTSSVAASAVSSVALPCGKKLCATHRSTGRSLEADVA